VSHSMRSMSESRVTGMRLDFLRSLAVLALVAIAFTACGPKKAVPPPAAAEAAGLYPTLADNPKPALEPYVLQVGDELAIKFYTNPELNEDVKIRPDGMISLQLIDDVPAAGRTPKELDADLTKRYTGELADPQISVIVKKAAGHRMYVDGQVGKPGVVTVVGGMTLYQALQRAGGLLETAHRKQIILIRKGADGTPVGHVVDIRPIQDGTNPAVDIPVRPLDIVYVPRSKIAEVDLFVKQYIRDALPIQTLPVPAF
jgi:polysaccharide biosynthesis/export protein PslD